MNCIERKFTFSLTDSNQPVHPKYLLSACRIYFPICPVKIDSWDCVDALLLMKGRVQWHKRIQGNQFKPFFCYMRTAITFLFICITFKSERIFYTQNRNKSNLIWYFLNISILREVIYFLSLSTAPPPPPPSHTHTHHSPPLSIWDRLVAHVRNFYFTWLCWS